jgi:hypothetical protein
MTIQNNRIKRLLWLMGGGAVIGVLLLLDFYRCPFKLLFHFPCPGCGMSRGFIAILHWRWFDAFNFNILSIPLFFALVAVGCLLLLDIVLSTNYSDKVLYVKLGMAHYGALFNLMILSWMMNIIRGI